MYIINLDDIDGRDFFECGNKALSLIQISSAVLIPPGFVLTARMFLDFLSFNDFEQQGFDPFRDYEAIRRFIMHAEFSGPMLEELDAHISELSRLFEVDSYAVRSSCVCEDSSSHSLAGVFDSYVKVHADTLLTAIKSVYSSLYSQKVMSMCLSGVIDQDQLVMPVIIQRYLSGTVSGVLFSVDTIGMEKSRAHINYSTGDCVDFIGNSATSGLYSVNRHTHTIQKENDYGYSLTDGLVKQLCSGMNACERILGDYQDIEWSYDGKDVYILQSRPITTFKNKDFPITLSEREEQHDWTLQSIVPYPPLMVDTIAKETKAYAKGAHISGYEHHYNLCMFQNGFHYTAPIPIHQRYKVEERFYAFLNNTHENGVNIFFDLFLPKYLDMIQKLETFEVCELSSEDLIAYLKLAEKYLLYTSKTHWVVIHGRKFRRIFETYCTKIDSTLTLSDFNDLIYRKSTLAHKRERLIKIADAIRGSSELFELFDECEYPNLILYRLRTMRSQDTTRLWSLLEQFAQDYSLFGAGDGPFLQPLYIENMEAIIIEIKPLIAIDCKMYFERVCEVEQNKQRIISRMHDMLDEEGFSEFSKKLALAEKAYLTGEEHNFYIECINKGFLKKALHRVARYWGSCIKDENDLHFLTIDEICQSLTDANFPGDVIASRKEEYVRQQTLFPLSEICTKPRHGQSGAMVVEDDEYVERGNILIQGISGLRKNARGIVRQGLPAFMEQKMVLALYNGHVGDITPLLPWIEGILFQEGSPFDHIGIIAREMQIPCIYYLKDAIHRIKDGDMVEINGTTGEVLIIREE